MLLMLIDRRGACHPDLLPAASPSQGEGSAVPGEKHSRRASPSTGSAALGRIDLSLLTSRHKAGPCNPLNSSGYVLCSPGVLLEVAPSPRPPAEDTPGTPSSAVGQSCCWVELLVSGTSSSKLAETRLAHLASL